jgi:hypothetical protein
MFGLFKKKVKSNALIFIFLKIIGLELSEKREISKQAIESGLDKFLKKANSQLSIEQQQVIASAIHIVLTDSSMQRRILELHKADTQNTEKLFIEILDDFQSYGIFC